MGGLGSLNPIAISLNAGGVLVTISGLADATIYYTTDGSTPTSASTTYTEALTLTDTTTVKAIAVKDNVSSAVTSRTFTKGSGPGGGV